MEKVFHHSPRRSKKEEEEEAASTIQPEKAELESSSGAKESTEQQVPAEAGVKVEVPIEIPIEIPVRKTGEQIEILEQPSVEREEKREEPREEEREEKRQVPTYAEMAAAPAPSAESKEEAREEAERLIREVPVSTIEGESEGGAVESKPVEEVPITQEKPAEEAPELKEERKEERLEERPMGGRAEERVELTPSEIEQLGVGAGEGQPMETEQVVREELPKAGGLELEEPKVGFGAGAKEEWVRPEEKEGAKMEEEKPEIKAEEEKPSKEELPPGPTEEERRRLERGAFVTEQPVAAEALGEREEGAKMEEERPMVREEGEAVPETKVEVEGGAKMEEERPMVRKEGEAVPQTKVEEGGAKIEEEERPMVREEGEAVPQTKVEEGGAKIEEERPMVREEGEAVPQTKVEEGAPKIEEEERLMVRKEGEAVPQTKVEEGGAKMEVSEEEQPERLMVRKRGDIVPQLKLELAKEEEEEEEEKPSREEVQPAPSEEERQRLERGALTIEQPVSAEVEHPPKREEKEEEQRVPIHSEEPERPSIEQMLEKAAEEKVEARKEELKGEVKEEIKAELEAGKKEAGGEKAQPSEEPAIQELEKVLKETSLEERKEERKEEKVVVIVGAGSGLGHPFGVACAKAILTKKPDWIVYLTDRDESLGAKVVRELNEEVKVECRFHPLDANSMVSLRNFRDCLTSKHGEHCIHLLINNVDSFPNIKSSESGADEFRFDQRMFEETVRTNYFGSLSVCLELFPLLSDDARVIFHASRFGQVAFLHTNETMQQKLRGCYKVEQVSELMELFVSTDLSAIASTNGWMSDSPMLQVYKSYTLGSIYPYGIANLGVSLLAFCYQRQFDEEKSSKHLHINACCPGLERGDKSPDEAVDSIIWLALELPDESDIKGDFVADRKVIDHFVIPPGQELF